MSEYIDNEIFQKTMLAFQKSPSLKNGRALVSVLEILAKRLIKCLGEFGKLKNLKKKMIYACLDSVPTITTAKIKAKGQLKALGYFSDVMLKLWRQEWKAKRAFSSQEEKYNGYFPSKKIVAKA